MTPREDELIAVHEQAVRRCGRFGQLCCENPYENVGAFYKIWDAGDYRRRADFGFQRASKHANHDIAGLRRGSSNSSASSRLR